MDEDLKGLMRMIACCMIGLALWLTIWYGACDARTPTWTWPTTLFGDKRYAPFDLWSIAHLCFGIVMGGTVRRWSHRSLQGTEPWQLDIERVLGVTWAIILACTWEVWEQSMEVGSFGPAVAVWKAGVEHWTNRYIVDIGAAVLGALLESRWHGVYHPAFALGVAWEVICILQPTAMTIQERLLQ